ncbi:Small nuclear ribonucleoprotein G [Penicillium rolfsii]|nr:Small nuclear ribonucleoprotein G [Penicillium rolfsii]
MPSNRDLRTLPNRITDISLPKMPQAQPELKKYMEKRVFCQLNGNRKVIGILRGYDVFMNIVLDEAFEEKAGGEKVSIGMVVIRGNSVVMLEALERINDK